MLYLLRHLTPDIPSSTCYGQLDVPLATIDAEVSTQLKHALHSVPNIRVWCSPLLRCVETANTLEIPYDITPALKEINFGTWEGQPWEAIPQKQIDDWAKDIEHFNGHGGESYNDLAQRVDQFISSLDLTEHHVCITHSGVIKHLLKTYGRRLDWQTVFGVSLPYGACFALPESM